MMEEIVDESGLASAMKLSQTHPVFLFKHSTTCPVSSTAYREVAAYVEGRGDLPPVYLIKVIESRPVSNAISASTGVVHQSPQLILVADEKAVWDASHYQISAEKIVKAASSSSPT